MTIPWPDPGSFRDPGGRVFIAGERILRAVLDANAEAYRGARDAGLYDALAAQNLLLPIREVAASELPGQTAARHVVEHPRIPYISYPYEWSFAAHRAAALLHLDVHLAAIERGFTLSDSTAFNVQFQSTRPVFIDHLSFRPYQRGEFWAGHRQFCMQFLNPLLFWTKLKVPPNPWFRGSLEGIAPEEIAPLLPFRSKLSWTVLSHVLAQAALQRRAVAGLRAAPRISTGGLPRNSFVALLQGLRDYVARLEAPTEKTVWSDYAGANSYTGDEVAGKRAFVGEMVSAVMPKLLFDIGCNTGDYSEVAIESGAGTVIGFDFDYATLDRAFNRFAASGKPFLPLWLDAANPSPSQGWAQQERPGLKERSRADALIALAFIHHIAIGRNIPLPMALDWLIGLAPAGVIEFPSKDDPMVQRLLARRNDIFPDYTEEAFTSLLSERARIVQSRRLSENGRLMVWFDRSRS